MCAPSILTFIFLNQQIFNTKSAHLTEYLSNIIWEGENLQNYNIFLAYIF
jgi:hypothetical protein